MTGRAIRQAREDGSRIGRRRDCKTAQRQISQAGEHGGDARQVARVVAAARCELWGNVGSVRFQHDRLERKPGGMLANSQRARIGQRATEPQLEAKPDERVGLLATAIERVGDTTRHPNPSQMLEYRVLGAPDVQQHRQIVFAGQLELFGEKPLLPYPIVAVDEKVEPDLADRYGTSERKLRIQFRDIAVLGTIDDHRVNAQRMVAPRVAKIEIGDDAEVLASDCRNDDLADAGVARGLHDSITIGRVFRGVEMTVSVDELHDFGARRQPGYFALRRLTKASIPCNVASSIMLQAIDSLAS